MTGWNGKSGYWRWQDMQGINWAEDSFLTDTGLVKQGFSCRGGGVSHAPCDTLNIGYTWDDHEAVKENRRLLATAAGIPLERWSCLRQVHGTKIRIVTEKDAGRGIMEPVVELPVADGQVTNIPGVVLVTLHADCIPIYIIDTKNMAIGLGHAGWKGTMADMAGALVAGMKAAFGSEPADMLASIGPGAGGCHYEVDEPVLAKVWERFGSRPDDMGAIIKPAAEPGKAYLDLGMANAILLSEMGIPEDRISLSGMCTIHEEVFFSHREGDRGRQAAFLALSRG
ncbi:MAG: peptidoglycan editing factor PgeF [Clostridiales bacterium]|nr:peptidoglycan editing factor PgeF [Clostridiales bacterium]